MVEESKIQGLVSLAKKGDAQAFGQIYDTLAKPIFNFLFARTRHRQQAEDLLQTVMLKVWHNLANYKPRRNAKFSTWVFQIANYTLIDYWRTRKETTDISAVENLIEFAQDPKLYEQYDYLWQALSGLSQECQTVLELRFRQDLNVSEVAQIMNKSLVGVRVLQHRAIKALRQQLIKLKKL